MLTAVESTLNVILEFCANGSLLMYLRSKKDNFHEGWEREEDADVNYEDEWGHNRRR